MVINAIAIAPRLEACLSYVDYACRTKIKQPPLFVLATGAAVPRRSTAAHAHPRHTRPTTYQCRRQIVLWTERFAAIFAVLPAKRPMDDVPAGWTAGEEFAFS
jgi:hypothetical protein